MTYRKRVRVYLVRPPRATPRGKVISSPSSQEVFAKLLDMMACAPLRNDEIKDFLLAKVSHFDAYRTFHELEMAGVVREIAPKMWGIA